MDNVSPELLQKCKDAFAKEYMHSKQVQKLVNRVRDGTATLEDAGEFSKAIGKMLGDTLNSVLTDEALPDGTLFWNIAKDVIEPMIDNNRGLVNQMATECQKISYKSNNIGISVKTPKKNSDRVKGLLDDVVAASDSEQRRNRIQAGIENLTDSFVDDFVESNADSADSVGLKTKVIRTSGGGCCAWCDSLAGEYDYDEVKDSGNEVWQRHTNCTCEITFISEKKTERVNNYKTINPARKRKS